MEMRGDKSFFGHGLGRFLAIPPKQLLSPASHEQQCFVRITTLARTPQRMQSRVKIAARVGLRFRTESHQGLLTLWTRTRCTAENAQRKAQRRRRVGHPASLCNAAMGIFGSNPKGTGGMGRHSLLLSSPRPLVLASSAAAIGAPCHPFAFAPIALTGPSSFEDSP